MLLLLWLLLLSVRANLPTHLLARPVVRLQGEELHPRVLAADAVLCRIKRQMCVCV